MLDSWETAVADHKNALDNGGGEGGRQPQWTRETAAADRQWTTQAAVAAADGKQACGGRG